MNNNYKNLLVQLNGGVLTITINRPEKLNALNLQTMEEISSVVDEVYDNDEIKAVIVTGSGQKAFVAGADISEIAEISPIHARKFAERGQEIFFKIENCHKPIIAAVNGFALGGGCELAMSCHFRIAAENAKFGQPEVNLGIIPGYGGTQRLVKNIGRGKAMELMMTGDMLDAKDAYQWGLVNHVVPADQLIGKVQEIINKILQKAPVAIGQVISCVNAVGTPKDGYHIEANAFGSCCRTEDFKEGTSAFLEKRKPEFKGK